MDVELYERDVVRPRQRPRAERGAGRQRTTRSSRSAPARACQRHRRRACSRNTRQARPARRPPGASRERARAHAAAARARPSPLGPHGPHQFPRGRRRRRAPLLAVPRHRRLAHSVAARARGHGARPAAARGRVVRHRLVPGRISARSASRSSTSTTISTGRRASVPPSEFRDKIVVIGSSSNHLRDFRATPVHRADARRRDPGDRDRQPRQRRPPHPRRRLGSVPYARAPPSSCLLLAALRLALEPAADAGAADRRDAALLAGAYVALASRIPAARRPCRWSSRGSSSSSPRCAPTSRSGAQGAARDGAGTLPRPAAS